MLVRRPHTADVRACTAHASMPHGGGDAEAYEAPDDLSPTGYSGQLMCDSAASGDDCLAAVAILIRLGDGGAMNLCRAHAALHGIPPFSEESKT